MAACPRPTFRPPLLARIPSPCVGAVQDCNPSTAATAPSWIVTVEPNDACVNKLGEEYDLGPFGGQLGWGGAHSLKTGAGNGESAYRVPEGEPHASSNESVT